jgi:hypothetical protein
VSDEQLPETTMTRREFALMLFGGAAMFPLHA